MKRKIKNILVYVLLFALPAIATAQETKKISLQEAIDLSIQNSKLLKADKARILEASAAAKQAMEHRLPEAGVSGSYLYLPIEPDVNMKSGSSNGSSTPEIKHVIYGTANVSVPVFTGGKIKYGIESAQFLEKAVQFDAENDKEEIKLNTINAFINLYKAKEAIAVVKENLQQSQQRVTDFTNMEKNGLLARNDLLKAELQASNVELSLLDAEAAWKIASVNMNLMLGLPEQDLLTADESSLREPGTIKTLDEYEQSALQIRKEITAFSYRKKAAEAGIKSAKADYYPNVSVSGGYVAADIPGFFSVTNAVNVGVGVKYNLSSLWKTKTTVKLAESRVQQVSANEEQLQEKIRLQVNTAYQAYLVTQKKIEVYEKALVQSQENYRITKNKFSNSLVTTTDLLDADLASLQAKLNAAFGKADIVAAYNKLLLSAGLLN